MASLNVNDNLITIFDGNDNFLFEIPTAAFKNIKSSSPTSEVKCPQDPYLGLMRYCSALSYDGSLYAVAEGRNLNIWSTSDWVLKCTKLLERSASKIVFTPFGEKVIVADKTGDVYSFSILDSSPKGVLLLGHLSILLDITISADEKFILTCDRDEKIRVTHYPRTYEIERFCLGHEAFVTRIVLLDEILLSSSGDGTLKFWKYLEGECVSTHNVYEDVKNELSSDLDPCIITNVATFKISHEVLVCLSVHKFDGVLVYRCNPTDFTVKLTQVIRCDEPLDMVSYKSFLWILKFSRSRVLNVFVWDGGSFIETASSWQNVLDIVDKKCSHLKECPQVDLTILCKMYALKEKVTKRIKTS